MQIPLGLTLYGSPKVLFILYALAAFTLLVLYFTLVRREKRHSSRDYDSRYGDDPSTVTDHRKKKHDSGGWLKAALAGAGLFAVIKKFRGRKKERDDRAPYAPEVVGSRRHSGSYVDDDKYSYYSNRGGRWEDRLLKVAAPIGLGWLVTRGFDRRYRDRNSDVGSYAPAPGAPVVPGAPGTPGAPGAYDPRLQPGYDPRAPAGYDPQDPRNHPPIGGPFPPGQPMATGPAPMAPGVGPTGMPIYPPQQPNYGPPGQTLPSEHHPLNRGHSRDSSYSYSYPSAVQERRESHGLRNGLATLGAMGLAKSWVDRWRDRREDRRLEDERNARLHGQHFTGDGRPIKRHHARSGSMDSESSITSPQRNAGPIHPNTSQGIPPLPAGTYAPGTAGAAAIEAERERERRANESLPLGGVPRSTTMPIIPPDPQGVLHDSSSSTDSTSSAAGQARRNSQTIRNTTTSGPAPPPPVFGSPTRRGQHQRNESMSPGEDSGVTSPPVSVRVKMHKDGRHVTLSRLPEQEAARRAQARQQTAQNESVSTLSGEAGPSPRFRRRDAQERQNEEAMRVERENLAAARNQAQASRLPVPVTPQNLPPPPPIPDSSGGNRPSPLGGSIGSPSQYTSDGQGTDYANNRKRRRAERARARQAKEEREARTGKTVGFE